MNLLREERLMLVTAQDENINGALFSLTVKLLSIVVLGELAIFLLGSCTVGKCSWKKENSSCITLLKTWFKGSFG